MPEPRASKRRVPGVASFCHRSNIITHDEPRCMNDMTPTRACSGACAGCVTLSASRAPRPPGRPPHFRRWTPNELPAVVASHARHRRRDRHRAAERPRRPPRWDCWPRCPWPSTPATRPSAARSWPWRWNAAPGSAPPSRPILGGLLFWQAAARAPARLRTAARKPADARDRRRLLFFACFLVGPFAEAATGFGVGMLGTVALLRGQRAPRHLMVFALLSQTLIPWAR